jgi:hypothetical protein
LFDFRTSQWHLGDCILDCRMVKERKNCAAERTKLKKGRTILSVELSGCWLRLSTYPKSHGIFKHSNEKMPVDIGVVAEALR